MTKQAFMDALRAAAAPLSEQEQARLWDYYSEMIDDRVEAGESEEEAVAAMGDPRLLARELAGTAPSREDSARTETVPALNHLRLRLGMADAKVIRGPLPEGVAAQVTFSSPERFELRRDGDAMEILEREPVAAGFGLRQIRQLLERVSLSATITLAGALPGTLDGVSGGGDIQIEGVEALGGMTLDSSSGDITLRDCGSGGALTLSGKSGDIELKRVRVDGAMRARTMSGDIEAMSLAVSLDARLESASGDVTLRQLECGALSVTTTSGDVELDRLTAGETQLRATSGDLRLNEVSAEPLLRLESTSGDAELERCTAPRTELRATSGDIRVRLPASTRGYDIFADTRSGDIRLPGEGAKTADPLRVEAHTVSGDIDIRISGDF